VRVLEIAILKGTKVEDENEYDDEDDSGNTTPRSVLLYRRR
jgi:hypothetical protein